MSDLRADEAGAMQGALKEMRKKDLTSHRHAGVELSRVPGEEKLRVRVSKNQATAETADEGEAGESNGDAGDADGGDQGEQFDSETDAGV